MSIYITTTLLLILCSCSVLADNFVSTKSKKVNMRTGPGIHYPVKYMYIQNHVPFKVIEEFESWKKVCDMDEDCGWIKSGLLSNKRYVMIKEDTVGYVKRCIASKILMKLDRFVIMELKKCDKDVCLLSSMKHKAWIQKKFIWGIE